MNIIYSDTSSSKDLLYSSVACSVCVLLSTSLDAFGYCIVLTVGRWSNRGHTEEEVNAGLAFFSFVLRPAVLALILSRRVYNTKYTRREYISIYEVI